MAKEFRNPGEVSWTYQQFVLEALNRINALSGGEGSSYNPDAHESCINDLWCAIPEDKKGEYQERWVSVCEEYSPWDVSHLSPEERRQRGVFRVCEKRQILTETLNSKRLNMLFESGSELLQELYDRGGDVRD